MNTVIKSLYKWNEGCAKREKNKWNGTEQNRTERNTTIAGKNVCLLNVKTLAMNWHKNENFLSRLQVSETKK